MGLKGNSPGGGSGSGAVPSRFPDSPRRGERAGKRARSPCREGVRVVSIFVFKHGFALLQVLARTLGHGAEGILGDVDGQLCLLV